MIYVVSKLDENGRPQLGSCNQFIAEYQSIKNLQRYRINSRVDTKEWKEAGYQVESYLRREDIYGEARKVVIVKGESWT